jgi:hypothetical protein
MNDSGWLRQPISEEEAARRLLQKGYMLSIGATGAALAGWQTENLVTWVDDLYVYPPRQAGVLGPPLLGAVEISARDLACEASVVLPPDSGRALLGTLLADRSYEFRTLAELDMVWREVLAPFVAAQDGLWVKRLRADRVTRPM